MASEGVTAFDGAAHGEDIVLTLTRSEAREFFDTIQMADLMDTTDEPGGTAYQDDCHELLGRWERRLMAALGISEAEAQARFDALVKKHYGEDDDGEEEGDG